MIRLTYISSARPDTGDAAIDAILAASRRNNRRDAISGLLLHDGRRFLQLLEGERGVVAAAYARILADPRHRACVMLDERGSADRLFGGWDMAWRRLMPVRGGGSLADVVDAMVAQVPDPSVRALFASFARIERPAA